MVTIKGERQSHLHSTVYSSTRLPEIPQGEVKERDKETCNFLTCQVAQVLAGWLLALVSFADIPIKQCRYINIFKYIYHREQRQAVFIILTQKRSAALRRQSASNQHDALKKLVFKTQCVYMRGREDRCDANRMQNYFKESRRDLAKPGGSLVLMP